MKSLTYKNHFKFGYNGKYFNFRKSPDDIWNVKYGRCGRYPFDFRTECVNAAKLIKESTDLPIYVLLSGGIDSEIVARSFIEANIPITCIIARFDGLLNEYDVGHAFKFCTRYDIPYEVYDVNIIDFWKNDLMKYAIKTNCISPQLPVIMWLSDQVNGHVVLGSGECYISKNEKSIWELWEKEKIASWYRHFLVSDKEGTPGFFQYTPELILSFITDQVISDMINLNHESSSYYEKNKIYDKYWVNLTKRSIYTGFEKYKEMDYTLCRPYLEKKFKGSDGIVKTPIKELIYNLSPIECKKISLDEIMKYHKLYEEEKMTLKRSPYDNVTESKNYYAAYINDELVGLTALDVFINKTGAYAHGSYTFPKFRGQGVIRALWNRKMEDIAKYPDILIHTIQPDWLPGATTQTEMLIRKGFKHTSDRPDGATVLTCKFKELK